MKEYFRKIFIVFVTFFFAFYINASVIDNSKYTKYMNLEDKSSISVVPNRFLHKYDVISRNYFNGNLSTYSIDSIPSSFDLRNDSGKRNVPTMDNQGKLNLCWAFSTNNVLESFLLKKGYKEYNFSENQMDYVARYLGDSDTFGGGNSISCVLDYWYSGYSPVTEDYFGSYFTSYKKKKMSEYIDSVNTTIDVRDALWFPYFDIADTFDNYDVNTAKSQLNTYTKDIKKHIMNYGGVATAIYTYFYKSSTNLLYNSGSLDYDKYASTSHAVTLIGWDDDYGSVKYNGNTLKGAWLAMNSWGSKTDYFYISYYDIDVYEELIGVRDAVPKTYDNSYTHHLKLSTSNNVDTYTYFIGKESEKVEGIKVFYDKDDKEQLTIKISDGTTSKTVTKSDLRYGINYFDVEDFYTNTNGYLYVYVTNPSNIRYKLNILTSSTNKNEKYYTKEMYEFQNKAGTRTRYHLISKNIASGTDYEIKIIDSSDNDITSNFTIEKNVDLINNYANFTLILNKVLNDTDFRIKIHFDGYVDYEKDDIDLDGSGTLSSPYLIRKAEDLKYLSNSSDYFKLMNDIDLKSSTTSTSGYYYNGGRGFIPFDFNGKFDGNNHTISNLNSYDGGLFGRLTSASISNLRLYNFNINIDNEFSYNGILSSYMTNSSISNVEIENSYIKGYNSVGSIAGQAENNVSINNVLINSSVNGNDNTGGLLGTLIVNNNKNVSIKNTFINDSNINGDNSTYTGSLIGYLFISASSATVDINNNNTYSKCKKIIGTTLNYNNLSYTYKNNNILSDVYDSSKFSLYDKSIWKYSPTRSLYLLSFPKSELDVPSISISVNKYDFNDDIIFISSDYNEVSDIIKNVIINNGLSYEFYDSKDNKLSSNSYVGTNGYIKVSNGVSSKDYHFVIYGDINGDGKVNIVDTMMCANYILDTSYDSNNLLHRAANVDKNKRIDIVDVIKISNYILSPEDGF